MDFFRLTLVPARKNLRSDACIATDRCSKRTPQARAQQGPWHWMTLIDYLHRDKGIDRFVVIMIEENLTRKKLYSISAC